MLPITPPHARRRERMDAAEYVVAFKIIHYFVVCGIGPPGQSYR